MSVETPSSRIHFVPPHIGHFLSSSMSSRPTSVSLAPALRPRGGRARSGPGCGPGILREPADDERREEQQAGLHRAGLVDADLDRSPAPALAVEDRELTVPVGERIALPP